jgi:hypothetical protein
MVILMTRWNQDSQGNELFTATTPAKVELVTTIQVTPVSATITNGTNLSASIDLAGKALVGIYMSAAWTAASMTFQGSLDGVTFFDIYDSTGSERLVQPVAGKHMALSAADWIGVRYIKLRSGTSATPVAQGADRVLTLVTRAV